MASLRFEKKLCTIFSMSEKDVAEKTLESCDDVFADILNALLFGGREVVQEDDLTDAQPLSVYKMGGGVRSQERDVAKYWRNKRIRLGLCGIDNQSAVDSDMPLRVIGYDGAAYRGQLSEKGQRERYPVVTLVLYFGTERRWTSPVSLKERLSVGDELMPFVSDYKLNLFELAWLSEEQIALFKSDFREVLEYLRAKRLRQRYEGSERQLRHIEEILDIFHVLSGEDSFKSIEPGILNSAKQSAGGMKMCDVIQAIKNEGFALGRNEGFALGRSEGFALGEQRGEGKLLSLFAKLYAAGRADDVQKATLDREYLKKLLDEHQK